MGTKNKPGVFDCYDAAEDDEPMFVLLARDASAPNIVEEWARCRFRKLAHETESVGDESLTRGLRKIAEALYCAQAMRDWYGLHV